MTKAAEQGEAAAQLWLARTYLEGKGVPKDPEKAKQWMPKAAEQGEAEAQSCAAPCQRPAGAQ